MANLYKVYNPNWTEERYDVHDSFICSAESEDEARNMNPEYSGEAYFKDGVWYINDKYTDGPKVYSTSWCNPNKAEVTLIGKTDESLENGIVLSSFNAG